MEIAQPAKISMLLYMMKIVIKSDAGMHRAAFFCFGAGRGVAEEKFFGAGQGEKNRGEAQ